MFVPQADVDVQIRAHGERVLKIQPTVRLSQPSDIYLPGEVGRKRGGDPLKEVLNRVEVKLAERTANQGAIIVATALDHPAEFESISSSDPRPIVAPLD